jgi:hypothetical protein
LTTHLDFKTDISGTHMDGVTEDINGKVVEKTYSFFQRFGNQNYIVTVDKDARDKVTGFSNTSYVPAPFGIAMDSKQAEALPTKEANKYEQKVTGVAHIHTTDGVDDTTNTIFKAERR